MKTLKYTLITIILFATGTAFGAVAIKKIEVLQKDNLAILYVAKGEIHLYKVDDGKNTCYITNQGIGNNGILNQHSLSCVKN